MGDFKIDVTLSRAKPGDGFLERNFTLGVDSPPMPIGRTSKRRSRGGELRDNVYLESPVISRSHAEIALDRRLELPVIKDVGSLHGTSLNNRRLIPFQNTTISNGDIITIGSDVTNGEKEYQGRKFKFNYFWRRSVVQHENINQKEATTDQARDTKTLGERLQDLEDDLDDESFEASSDDVEAPRFQVPDWSSEDNDAGSDYGSELSIDEDEAIVIEEISSSSPPDPRPSIIHQDVALKESSSSNPSIPTSPLDDRFGDNKPISTSTVVEVEMPTVIEIGDDDESVSEASFSKSSEDSCQLMDASEPLHHSSFLHGNVHAENLATSSVDLPNGFPATVDLTIDSENVEDDANHGVRAEKEGEKERSIPCNPSQPSCSTIKSPADLLTTTSKVLFPQASASQPPNPEREIRVQETHSSAQCNGNSANSQNLQSSTVKDTDMLQSDAKQAGFTEFFHTLAPTSRGFGTVAGTFPTKSMAPHQEASKSIEAQKAYGVPESEYHPYYPVHGISNTPWSYPLMASSYLSGADTFGQADSWLDNTRSVSSARPSAETTQNVPTWQSFQESYLQPHNTTILDEAAVPSSSTTQKDVPTTPSSLSKVSIYNLTTPTLPSTTSSGVGRKRKADEISNAKFEFPQGEVKKSCTKPQTVDNGGQMNLQSETKQSTSVPTKKTSSTSMAAPQASVPHVEPVRKRARKSSNIGTFLAGTAMGGLLMLGGLAFSPESWF